MSNLPSYVSALNSQRNEITVSDLEVQGKIPKELNGDLVRVAPAIFEVGNEPFKHWFDGLSMAYKFEIKPGKVNYQNRFLQSEAFKKNIQMEEIHFKEFGTAPTTGLLDQMFNLLFLQETDNCNVNIFPEGDEWVAMTETYRQLVLDNDLNTLGHRKFDDTIKGQISTAHPVYDKLTKQWINISVEVNPFHAIYRVYSFFPGSSKRKILGEYKTKEPFYQHSFGMSENYIILVAQPLVGNLLKLLFPYLPFIGSYHWEENKRSRFIIIDKRNGKTKVIESETFFVFHVANAFEEGDEIILDLCTKPSADVIDFMYLDKMKKSFVDPNAKLERFRLNLNTAKTKRESLFNSLFEFPQMNNNYFAKKQEYLYGLTQDESRPMDLFNKIIKFSIEKEKVTSSWFNLGMYPGEPVFVSVGDKEDSGYLLSVVFDSTKQQSFLLILSAEDLSEVATVYIPGFIPFGFHGTFKKINNTLFSK